MTDEKVTSIETARKKKKSTLPGDGRPPALGEIYRAVVDAIMRSPVSLLPAFPHRYEAIEPETGIRLPLLVSEDESVAVVRVQALATHILQYCHTLGVEYAFKAKQAHEIADLYLGLVAPIAPQDIKMVRWSDEPGLTYRRLPWRREEGPAPTWEALLSRMSNAQAFIDWTGSLFFEEADLQQYLFLFGRGGDGKGSISRFYAKVMEKAYRSKQPPTRGDRFWSYGILKSRIVVFPDCNDTNFLSSGQFKSLTGGDPVDVEAKGEMSFTTIFNAKYMVISNERPMISSQKSDMRRIIFCELSSSPDNDPLFEDRLWLEGGAFLTACIRHYENRYPEHGPIVADCSEVSDWTDTLEEGYQEAFAQWFVLDPTGEVAPGRMQMLMRERWAKDKKSQLGFLKFLEMAHGVKKKSIRTGECVTKSYKGISLKTENSWSNRDEH